MVEDVAIVGLCVSVTALLLVLILVAAIQSTPWFLLALVPWISCAVLAVGAVRDLW